MRVVRRLRLALSCSLALVCGLVVAQPDYASLARDLERNPDRLPALARELAQRQDVDKEMRDVAIEILKAKEFNEDDALWLVDEFSLRARVQSPPTDSAASRAKAAEIKKSPLYRDSSKEEGNWLAKAFTTLFDWLRRLMPDRTAAPSAPLLGVGRWIHVVAWALLGIVAAVFLFLAIRGFRRLKVDKKKRGAVLDESEPERTLDEWLEMATKLRSEEKYREAVRCLYVACLLRYEELGVAPFRRHETNWEHLARIRQSAKQIGLEFEPSTRQFDLVWYGHRVRGAIEVDEMEEFYRQLASTPSEAAA